MIDCDKITKDTKNLMFQLTDESDKDGIERYIRLCRDDNKIISSNVCTGESCRITPSAEMATTCPKGTMEIGSFHAHPNGGEEASYEDIVSEAVVRLKSFCIGYSTPSMKYMYERDRARRYGNITENIVKCYDIIDKELLRLGNKAQDLAQKGEIKKAQDLANKMIGTVRESRRTDFINTKCVLTRKRLW